MVGIVISCMVKHYVHRLKPFRPADIQAFGPIWTLESAHGRKEFFHVRSEQLGDQVQGMQLNRLAPLLDIRYRGPREAEFVREHLLRNVPLAPHFSEHAAESGVKRLFSVSSHA
jgi:hypothetical protein